MFKHKKTILEALPFASFFFCVKKVNNITKLQRKKYCLRLLLSPVCVCFCSFISLNPSLLNQEKEHEDINSLPFLQMIYNYGKMIQLCHSSRARALSVQCYFV